ncbi:unnamed protein product [Trichobilharzia regenti]|nr:unnamed protein product [Trichobilharzia regenti]
MKLTELRGEKIDLGRGPSGLAGNALAFETMGNGFEPGWEHHHSLRNAASPLFYVRAKFDFHDTSNNRFLSLSGGDRVAVVSRAAEDRGWWKGWLNGRVSLQMFLISLHKRHRK